MKNPPRKKPVALKHWGLVLSRVHLDGARVESAWIAKGGVSSVHHHKLWFNTFTLVSGRLTIASSTGHIATLLAGGTYTTVPGRVHRFIADDDCHLIEVYSHSLGIDIEPGDIDIERHTAPTAIPRISFDGVLWRDNQTGMEWTQSKTG